MEWIKREVNNIKDDNFDDVIEVYNKGIKKLIEVISLTCKEQGLVLNNIWTEYDKKMKEKINLMKINQKENERKLNKLSWSLITKFENNYKKYEIEIIKLKEQINNYMKEENKMINKLNDYQHDNELLIESNNKHKMMNSYLAETVSILSKANKELKIILYKNDEEGKTN